MINIFCMLRPLHTGPTIYEQKRTCVYAFLNARLSCDDAYLFPKNFAQSIELHVVVLKHLRFDTENTKLKCIVCH